MTQKTASLLAFGGLLVVLGLVILLWRSLPAAGTRMGAQQDAFQKTPSSTTTEPALQVSTSKGLESVSATSSLQIPPLLMTSSTSGEISLLAVGDIMLDRNVADRTKKSGDAFYPFRQLPENWISGFDLALANLEGPVTPTRRPPVKSIDFQFDPSWLPRLKQEGFDVFSQANNHALDQGAPGYTDSVSRLRKAGFVTFGHQVDDGLIALATTTVKGERLAFLGWNTTDNPINLIEAKKAIVEAKAQSDVVIAFLHWGIEYQDHPTNDTKTVAHWLIDQGVDVVLGGHPHWAQGISSYKGKPIVWSLGNFVFDQDWSKETQQGLAVEFKIAPETIRLLPVPLSIKLSQPKKEVGASLTTRLETLAKISDGEFQQTIKEGKELIFQRSNEQERGQE